MLDQFLTQFLDHLRYERNVSAHTLRNYESDLRQFFDYLAPADERGKRQEPPVAQIDHLTIREWLATLHSDQKKKTSIARKSLSDRRSEEHTSELQSRFDLVCRLLLEKK